MIRGIRGATTVAEDTEEAIIEATAKLLKEMIELNHIDPDNVASVFISVTDDITAAFPARAIRTLEGWTFVPVMCMKEIPVDSSLKMCIRIMAHVNTYQSQKEINHVYQGNAIGLRPDLNQNKDK